MYIHASVDPPPILSLNHPPALSPSSLSFCFDRPPSLRAQTELNNDGTNRFTPRPRGLRLVHIKMPAVKNTRNRLLFAGGGKISRDKISHTLALVDTKLYSRTLFHSFNGAFRRPDNRSRIGSGINGLNSKV